MKIGRSINNAHQAASEEPFWIMLITEIRSDMVSEEGKSMSTQRTKKASNM